MVTRFQKRILVGLGIILCLLLVTTQGNEHFRYYGISDWLAWFDSLGEHPDTVFASGFSEQRFSKVKPNMTKNEVSQILGEPLGKTPWDLWGADHLGECWDYSDSTTNILNYHLRRFIFNPDGKVEYIAREYYSEAYESGF